MILKINETRVHKVENETINGLNICVLLESAAVDTAVPDTGYMTAAGFDPSNVNIEVTLMRNGVNYPIINANLAVLGQYQTINKNGNLWRRGLTLQKKGAATTHIVSRSLFVDFGGHLNIAGSDQLVITATMNRGSFGAGIDSSNSNLQIEVNQSIGVELFIPRFHQYAIQASQSSDLVNLGDNVTRIALLSFETDFETPIFRSVSLSSDRLDWTANEQELILRHWREFSENYADNLLAGVSVDTQPGAFPSTFLLHTEKEIDRAKIQFTMTPANVDASMNFVCWNTFITSQEILVKAQKLHEKHQEKDIAKVPITV